jgi:3-deoxy-D-manno-octulosonate 8-phosphate phosphatase (KDO 8-P phosphatase)
VDGVVTLTAAPRVLLTPPVARTRAQRVRLLITDCDGVLTDGSVYYGASGERLRRFSVRDGMGVERLREAGIETAILSGERCESIRQRAAKLELGIVQLGARDKAEALGAILAAAGLGLGDVAYIGDDVNDLPAMDCLASCGLTAAPADAFGEVAEAVHYVCQARGGFGAFREFAEWILENRRGTLNYRRRDAWHDRS